MANSSGTTAAAKKSARAAKPRKGKQPEQPQVRSPGVAASQTAPKKDRRGAPKGKGVAVGKSNLPQAKGKPAGRIGNPPFVSTDEQRAIVRTHAACGTPYWLIAEVAFTPPISESTLRRHFKAELETGLLQVNARMASLIARQGLSGCRQSQRLWMVTRGGWKMGTATEHSGPDGGPIPVAGVPARNPNLKHLSDEELAQYEALQAKLEGPADAGDA